MSTFLYFLVALGVSLGGLWALLKTDRKRRRVFFRKAESEMSVAKISAGWLVTLMPGLVLLVAAQYSAFLSWIGCLTVVGWRLAARAPITTSPHARSVE